MNIVDTIKKIKYSRLKAEEWILYEYIIGSDIIVNDNYNESEFWFKNGNIIIEFDHKLKWGVICEEIWEEIEKKYGYDYHKQNLVLTNVIMTINMKSFTVIEYSPLDEKKWDEVLLEYKNKNYIWDNKTSNYKKSEIK